MGSNDSTDELLEEIIERFEGSSVQEAVTVIEGLVTTRHHPYAERLNLEISRALDADIVFVAVPGNESTTDINHRLEIVVDTYGGHKSQKVVGCIFNKVNAPFDEHGRLRADIGAIEAPEHDEERGDTKSALQSIVPSRLKPFLKIGKSRNAWVRSSSCSGASIAPISARKRPCSSKGALTLLKIQPT